MAKLRTVLLYHSIFFHFSQYLKSHHPPEGANGVKGGRLTSKMTTTFDFPIGGRMEAMVIAGGEIDDEEEHTVAGPGERLEFTPDNIRADLGRRNNPSSSVDRLGSDGPIHTVMLRLL